MKARPWLPAILLLIVLLIVTRLWIVKSGLSNRTPPSAFEVLVAKSIRHWSVPVETRKLTNPIPTNAEVLEKGRAHWADHCATCHANNGRGDTEIGKNLYPRAPDMRSAETQSLSDGELYFVIRNGVPMTGMPAWGNPNLSDPDSESWMLVSFIRHLPNVTTDEEAAMERLNPKSAMEREEEEREEEFLSGKTRMEDQHDY